MKYTVKYEALYNAIGCNVLKEEVDFTKELTKLILREFVQRVKAKNYNILGEPIDGILDLTNSDFVFEQDSESNHEGINMKSTYFDVRFNFSNNNIHGKIDYELQRQINSEIYPRTNYYLMTLASRAFGKGELYTKPHFSFVIWFFGEKIADRNDYFRCFSLRDFDNNMLPYSHIIELDLTQLDYCANIKLKKYLSILKEKDFSNFTNGDDDILDKTIMRIVGLNGDERILKEIEDEERRQFSEREGKRFAYMEGKAEGRAEGKAEAILEIALNMLQNGIDLNTISLATNLSIEEIQKLDK